MLPSEPGDCKHLTINGIKWKFYLTLKILHGIDIILCVLNVKQLPNAVSAANNVSSNHLSPQLTTTFYDSLSKLYLTLGQNKKKNT